MNNNPLKGFIRRSLWVSWFILFAFPGFSQSVTLDEVRTLYAQCSRDKQVCERLFTRLSESHAPENFLLNGYYGAVAANLANHAKEPAQKIRLFNQGRRLLEDAIRSDSLSMELRFLRFTIQSNCPPSLHYSKNMAGDKLFILNHLEQAANNNLQKNMASFLDSSVHFTKEEKEKVRMFVDRN